MDPEWMFRYQDSPREVCIEFFDERTAVTIGLRIQGDANPDVTAVHARSDEEGDWDDLDYMVQTDANEDGALIRIHLQTAMRATQVRITLREELLVPFAVAVTLTKGRSEDLAGLARGFSFAEQGNLGRAISELEQYCRVYSDRNPFVNVHLAIWNRELGRIKQALEAALKACAVGNIDACRPAYIEVQKAREKQTIESMRILQERAGHWEIDGEPGAVVLDLRRELAYEIVDAVQADCTYMLMEIRSASAGRKLQRIGFTFDDSKEEILYSTCRIIRADDSVEEMLSDRTTIRDDQHGNPLIMMERKRTLAWILPELKVGDLLETRFHRLRGGRRVNGTSWPGKIEAITDHRFPTFSATVVITAPPEVDLNVVPINCDARVNWWSGIPGRSRGSLHLDQNVPVSHTGHDFEHFLLAPHVAVGPAGATWADYAREQKKSLLGEHEDEPLPVRLAEIVEASGSPAEALEHCFYMLRDDLKYAATPDAKKRIGVSGRADEILESGVGDCADKSFLLHLVCRELGLSHDFVLFDATGGTLCEEVPSDVFDHVLLRVELEGEQYWLDASDDLGVFGSIPAGIQGMKGLALDEEGTVVKVPEDSPHRNRVIIRETFDRIEDHMLTGTFEFEAHGSSGRMLEEHLKSAALDVGTQARGSAIALMMFFPEQSLQSMEVESHATHSTVCRIRGHHTRGRISHLSGSGDEFVRLAWSSPHLAFWEWPHLDRSRLMRVGMPITVRIELEFGREVAAAVSDRSVIDCVDNELYSMSEQVDEVDGHLRVCRELVLHRGTVTAPMTELVPGLTESVARFCTLALRLDGREKAKGRAMEG